MFQTQTKKFDGASYLFLEFKDQIILCKSNDRGTSWHHVLGVQPKTYGLPMILPSDKEVSSWLPDFSIELLEAFEKSKSQISLKPKMKV